MEEVMTIEVDTNLSGIQLDSEVVRLEKKAYDRTNDKSLKEGDIITVPSDWNGFESTYSKSKYQRVIMKLNGSPRSFSVSTIFGTNSGAFKRSDNIMESLEKAIGKSFKVQSFEHIEALNIDRPVFNALS
jgi:hypothetical protein